MEKQRVFIRTRTSTPPDGPSPAPPVGPTPPPGQTTVEIDDPGGLELTYGGSTPKGGTTLVVGFDGKIKYCVVKPLPGAHLPPTWQQTSQARINKQAAYVAAMDARDPRTAYLTVDEYLKRSTLRANMAAMHFSR